MFYLCVYSTNCAYIFFITICKCFSNSLWINTKKLRWFVRKAIDLFCLFLEKKKCHMKNTFLFSCICCSLFLLISSSCKRGDEKTACIPINNSVFISFPFAHSQRCFFSRFFFPLRNGKNRYKREPFPLIFFRYFVWLS